MKKYVAMLLSALMMIVWLAAAPPQPAPGAVLPLRLPARERRRSCCTGMT